MTWTLSRRGILTTGLFALAGSLAARRVSLAQASAQRLVTIELFTSQGCSSCPPADALLGKLAGRENVLALSWPVDYWDYLGWRDTLAKPAFTQRQRDYARKLPSHQPYTPQMVIDGEIDVVGSNAPKVEAALSARLKQAQSRVPIAVNETPDSIVIEVGTGMPCKASLWLVRYRPRVEVEIGAGENQGRDVAYTNVVESVSPLGMWSGEAAQVKLARADLGAMDHAQGMAVLLQGSECGPVLGAARIG